MVKNKQTPNLRMAATTGAIEAPSDAHKNPRTFDLHLDFFDHILLQALLSGEKREVNRYPAQSSRTDRQTAPQARGSGPFPRVLRAASPLNGGAGDGRPGFCSPSPFQAPRAFAVCGGSLIPLTPGMWFHFFF